MPPAYVSLRLLRLRRLLLQLPLLQLKERAKKLSKSPLLRKLSAFYLNVNFSSTLTL